jgi:threonine/homoserine efflux transporter RhtA
VIYSADPAIAAVIGVIALSETLTTLQIAGIAAVIAASAGVTAGAPVSD